MTTKWCWLQKIVDKDLLQHKVVNKGVITKYEIIFIRIIVKITHKLIISRQYATFDEVF